MGIWVSNLYRASELATIYLARARHRAKHFTCITLFGSQNNSVSYSSHFTDEETGGQKGEDHLAQSHTDTKCQITRMNGETEKKKKEKTLDNSFA